MRTRTNPEWLRELQSSGAEQTAAITELRAYLVRAARYALHRSRGSLSGRTQAEINQLAEDCAQDALVAILQHLHAFRGAGQFTTWAYKFAIHTALVTVRREAWKHISLDELLDHPDFPAWPVGGEHTTTDPGRQALQREAWAVIREAIEHHLTRRQQQVLKAIVFDAVPLDELVRHWGSNRNAIYKLLHDARRKLKAHLETRGFGVHDILDLFRTDR